ncbi:AraC family transcriptional regulator [Isobaculum melis]|uniref:AraC-type DNA-binding protein n=1 Tax=Isobaculum melis TaxID=142588 RepID=A0A1H9QWA6_9LACT|nr:AraC family transcriptional regulator [Isobaculum melis]SER64710.1 AraC-type DNA-binding protein [Isobaculum melis]
MEFKHEVIQYTNTIVPINWIIHNSSHGGSSVLPHWHQSLEISLTVAGSIPSYKIHAKEYQTHKGSILIINPAEVHSVFPGITTTIDAMTIQVPYALLKKMIPHFEYMRFVTHPNQFVDKQEKVAELQKCLFSFYEAVASQDELYQEMQLLSLTYQLLYLLAKDWMYQVKDSTLAIVQNVGLEKVGDIIAYIQEHYTLELSVQFLAETFHLSTFYLAKLFKKYLGMGVMSYVRLVRVQHGERYLMHTDKPIAVISDLVGFANVKSFRQTFIHLYGVSPKQYQLDVRSQKDEDKN